jgi:uncharacterized protein (DUF433 family)
VKTLEAAERAIHRDKDILGGEPVFRGTRVPVCDIAAMLDAGASAAEILAGYPSLDQRLLDLARLWAAAHPRRGRPKTLAPLGLTLRRTKRVPLRGDPLEVIQGQHKTD